MLHITNQNPIYIAEILRVQGVGEEFGLYLEVEGASQLEVDQVVGMKKVAMEVTFLIIKQNITNTEYQIANLGFIISTRKIEVLTEKKKGRCALGSLS